MRSVMYDIMLSPLSVTQLQKCIFIQHRLIFHKRVIYNCWQMR